MITVGTAANGTVNTEVWNVSPNKSRTVVLQSTIKQFSTGSITVSNGKQVWQYDPAKKLSILVRLVTIQVHLPLELAEIKRSSL